MPLRRLEIAAKYGHNQAFPHTIPSLIMLTFEDFQPGHFGTFGPRHVSREEILAFAAEFDPQPMHLDEEAAKRSMLKGLAGSGWHLGSIMMRMMFDGFIGRTASLGSPGINELRWPAPLRPGDDLTLDVDVTEGHGPQCRGRDSLRNGLAHHRQARRCQSMIWKSGHRFSEKIMLNQRDEIVIRFNVIESRSKARA
jgi:acyl dehydratase